jgi:hypothetical protein
MPLAQAIRVQPTYAKLKHQKPDRTLPACSRSSPVLSFTQPLARPLAWAHQEAAPHQHLSSSAEQPPLLRQAFHLPRRRPLSREKLQGSHLPLKTRRRLSLRPFDVQRGAVEEHPNLSATAGITLTDHASRRFGDWTAKKSGENSSRPACVVYVDPDDRLAEQDRTQTRHFTSYPGTWMRMPPSVITLQQPTSLITSDSTPVLAKVPQ